MAESLHRENEVILDGADQQRCAPPGRPLAYCPLGGLPGVSRGKQSKTASQVLYTGPQHQNKLLISVIVLTPRPELQPFVEAYYLTPQGPPGGSPGRFPASLACYIKLSPTTSVLSGQATGPVEPIGNRNDAAAGMAIKLRPGAAQALFGLPAAELTNRVLCLEEVCGARASELVEQIARETDPQRQVRCAEQHLMRFAPAADVMDSRIEQRAVEALRKGTESSFETLADALGYSSRQLRRRLLAFVGMSPRLVDRLSRFERALSAVQHLPPKGPVNWPDLALECGYCDQSHFIREFLVFSGSSPDRYLAILHAV